MYLVGLVVQAAVLGALVAGALMFEAPVRNALDLPPPRDVGVSAALEGIETRLAGIENRLDTLVDAARRGADTSDATAETLAELSEATDAIATSLEGGAASERLARRLAVVERLVARVESKVDDVRDAQLFPAPEPNLGTSP
jgi:hypothetical protein